MAEIILYDYWRSTASYRVRIALNLAGLDYRLVSISLIDGQQKETEHMARNPQGFVPVLEIDGLRLTQSLAILDYLEETGHIQLYPNNAEDRARARTLAHIIAMDIHPVCNLSVVNFATELAENKDTVRQKWMGKFIRQGLEAFEKILSQKPNGQFSAGDTPGIADICLIPQLYNADRWHVVYDDLSEIIKVSQNCLKLEAFAKAAPEEVHQG